MLEMCTSFAIALTLPRDRLATLLAISRGGEVVFYDESPGGTVAVIEQVTQKGAFRRLYIQGVSNSGDVMPSLRCMRLQALIPLLIHPGEPRSALVIGLGTGITSGALLADPSLERRLCPEVYVGDAQPVTDDRPRIEYAKWVRAQQLTLVLPNLLDLRRPPPVEASADERARIETSHQRLVDFYDISLLAYVADREAWAAEQMAARVRDFRQTAEPNAYYDWFFGR